MDTLELRQEKESSDDAEKMIQNEEDEYGNLCSQKKKKRISHYAFGNKTKKEIAETVLYKEIDNGFEVIIGDDSWVLKAPGYSVSRFFFSFFFSYFSLFSFRNVRNGCPR